MTSATPQTFRFLYEESGFCRSVYRGEQDRVLYCIQDDGLQGLNFYDCTPDGEPNCPRAFPMKDRFDHFVDPRG